MTFRQCLVQSVVVLAALTISGASQAESGSWPSRPIRVVVPIGAGSAIDIIPRAILDEVSKQVGQPIVIENRPGAGTIVGTVAVSKASPDGYTLLSTSGALTIAEVTAENPQFQTTRDFVGIGTYGTMANVLVIAPSKGIRSVKELVDKGKAAPGLLNYGTAGVGTPSFFNAVRFLSSAGIQAQPVPFKGATEAVTEVMTGRIDFYFMPLLPALSLIKDGKLLPLAVSGSRRSALLPDVPTTVEAGYPGSSYNFWIGMVAPSKTDKSIVDRMHGEIERAVAKPELAAKLKGFGLDIETMAPAQFDQMLKAEVETNAHLLRAAGPGLKK